MRSLMPVILFLFLLSLFSTADGVEAPLPGIAVGDLEIISMSKNDAVGAKPTVSVLESDVDGLLLEFDLAEIQVQALEIEGQSYHAIEIAGGAWRGEEGEPMLPTFSKLIQIPDYVGVEYIIETVTTTELSGYRPMPMQPGQQGDFTISPAAYHQIGFDETPPLEIGDPAIARDLRLVPITFNPVRYNPAEDMLEVASRITVRINYSGEDLRNAAPQPRTVIPESFHNLYKSMVVNYSGPRDDQIIALGTVAFICPNNSTVVSKLEPLIEWRKRQGYDVVLATTAETGTTPASIKNWIQLQYVLMENPPAFINLVGDANGSIAIPTWFEIDSGYNGEGDHTYVELSGNDALADAHIGRISVSTTSQLELYVHKIVSYESTPYTGETSWYKRGCVCGDPSSSGLTTVQCMQWLKRLMLQNDYAEVDTIFSSPFASQITNGINEGCSGFSYRGYWHMSGYGTSQIDNLANGRKMPFAVILTCDTGSFASGYARSEAFMRAGNPPATPTAGIASIGTATIGTHTRYNNCVTYGIWWGIYHDELTDFGASLTRGKYELYLNYSKHSMSNVRIFSHWNNLMGDAAGRIWTDIPQAMTVDYSPTVALGANSVVVDVSAGGADCAGAFVCLWKGDEVHVGGYTDQDGHVELPVAMTTTGDMKITITKQNHSPHISSITVNEPARFAGYYDHSLDGDGNLNPGEAVGLSVQIKNFGSQTLSNITGVITSNDPYVTITDNSESFGTLAAGAIGSCIDDFDLEIDPGAPYAHVIHFGLELTSGSDTWHSLIELPVTSAQINVRAANWSGVGSELDPGETGELMLEINNLGNMTATAIQGTLFTDSGWLTIIDGSASFGTIPTGTTGNNSGDLFEISASPDCYPGHTANLKLVCEFSDGMLDTVEYAFTIGIVSTTDPTGPDAYGYYAYDNTDVGFPEAPIYDWIEIAANYGGPGTSVGLTDFDRYQDDSRVVDLPFPFVYYGETFTKATICSNGWVSMGSTHLTNYRNWQIPCAGAPPYMIAPMWDNLEQYSSDVVYHWFDETNHLYVIQWSRVKNNYPGNNTRSNFEVILYDPAYYDSPTGDGVIVFQYDMYSNQDSQQMYSTTGIQNGDNSTGVLYSYWDDTNTGGAPIQPGRAIKFLPMSNEARGSVMGHVSNLSFGGDDLPGVMVRFIESGQTFTSNENGTFSGMVLAGSYTAEATHPSFATVVEYDVEVAIGEVTILDFEMVDIVGPEFTDTTEYESTDDQTGPYRILTTMTEYSGVEESFLYYKIGGGEWTTANINPLMSGEHEALIPGATYSQQILYYLYGRDTAGNEGWIPAGGESDPFSFYVMPATLDEEMEDGAPGWTHTIGSAGFTDEWHLSTSRNHTPEGGNAWKFGSVDGVYADLADGVLLSEPFVLEGDATLSFWHWMEAEESTSYPGYAFDGGFVELSVDGGEWTQINPVGGYPYLLRVGSGPGPYPADTPMYSGSFDWTRAEFRLVGVTGSIQVRFRFGSDGAEAEEGWYIDDVYIMPDSPPYSATDEEEVIPMRLSLYQNQPNPFGQGISSTRIQYDLPETTPVRLQVYDASGRLVRILVNDTRTAGHHVVSWDGRDFNSHQVGSGVYFYILSADGVNSSRQMLILK